MKCFRQGADHVLDKESSPREGQYAYQTVYFCFFLAQLIFLTAFSFLILLAFPKMN